MPTSALVYVGNEQKDAVGSAAAGATPVLIWRSDTPVPDWGQAVTIAELAALLEFVRRGA